jgi:uncharacterized protein (UPF0210 family)
VPPAQQAVELNYSINELLLYMAAGGTGLDMIPLPGDAGPEQIAGLLLDAATLAVALNRPFIARLLPTPGCQAGDVTTWPLNPAAKVGILPLKAAATATIFNQGFFFDLNGQ